MFLVFPFIFNSMLEQVSLEYQRVIAFVSLHNTTGLKKLVPLFIQSELKPKPIVTRSQAFSRALRKLYACD